MVGKQENKVVNDSAVIIWKEVGETPLEALERFRAEEISLGRAELVNAPMTYAGRLDPMAEGELLVLIGEECKKKGEYLGLDKEYEVEIVFGIETDTYDSLGMATIKDGKLEINGVGSENNYGLQKSNARQSGEILSRISEEVTKKVVTFTQVYPPYSSRTVDGKQLHELARAGELPEEMPTKEVTLYSIEVLRNGYVSAGDLLKKIPQKISFVRGDFRQEEILKRWREVLDNSHQDFFIVTLKVLCSSGTYMRSLAHELGEKVGTGAFALSITRTAIRISPADDDCAD